jgi:glutathione S-transferase
MFYAAGPVEAAVTNRSLGVEVPDDKRAMVGYGSFDAVVETLEQAVTASPYLAGDRFTAADVYAGSQVAWGVMFGSLPKRDAFEAYIARISARPAAVRAREIDDALVAKAQATA